MKEKNLKRTLKLKKETVTNLEAADMNTAKGGGTSDFSICFGYCIPNYSRYCPTVTCAQYNCTG